LGFRQLNSSLAFNHSGVGLSVSTWISLLSIWTEVSANSFNMNTVTAQAAGSADPPCCPFVPLCFECGTLRNPCHCRILGPTLGFVAFAVAACVEWPVGAFVYCFRHLKGRRIMAHPAVVVYPRVASCLPI
jgi:hypothetical protein